MLYKMANTKWKDVISRKDETDTDTLIYAKQDFEDFKNVVDEFTITKVFDDDAYDLKKYIGELTKKCDTCQLGKRGGKGHDKIPIKEAECERWHHVAVDLATFWNATVDLLCSTY